MPGVRVSIIRPFDRYKIPKDNNKDYECPHWKMTTAHSRVRWINHLHDRHHDELTLLVEGFRAINNALQTITDDDEQDEIDHDDTDAQSADKNQTRTIEQKIDDEPMDVKLKKLVKAKEDGLINDQEFFAQVKKLCELAQK